MFEYAISERDSLYVGIYSGDCSDEDYERCVSSMTDFERAQRGHAQGIICILVNDPDVPPVPAAWRKRMADFNQSVQASRYLLSIVTPSAVIRGILTAINWMSPAKPGHKKIAHETFGQACAWIEQELGSAQPALQRLHREARAAVRERQSA